jgi:ubiquinone/menaquinone biosynthesis C-methylase UbiE
MPDWTDDDLNQLEPILRTIERDLYPLPGKDVLILCCGSGQMALRLGKKMDGAGKVVGLDLSEELLERAREDVKAEKWKASSNFKKRKGTGSLSQTNPSTP